MAQISLFQLWSTVLVNYCSAVWLHKCRKQAISSGQRRAPLSQSIWQQRQEGGLWWPPKNHFKMPFFSSLEQSFPGRKPLIFFLDIHHCFLMEQKDLHHFASDYYDFHSTNLSILSAHFSWLNSCSQEGKKTPAASANSKS